MGGLHERLRIAWMKEEEWGVTSILGLLLRIFRALLAEYEDAAFAAHVESLYNLPPAAAELKGTTLLKEFVGDRNLLLIMENLDDLFEGLSEEGQKRFFAYLQEHPFWTILATAKRLFNGVSLQTSPFYGFFHIHHLKKLDIDNARLLLTKIASFKGDYELTRFIQTQIGINRLHAIYDLAGGNHRVFVILSQHLTCKSLDQVVDLFMETRRLSLTRRTYGLGSNGA